MLEQGDIAIGAGAPARGGRPLDASRDSAILAAALQLIGEVGYERVTMDAIAARCHASKATMYRRWSGKASLVAEAVRERQLIGPLMTDSGDVRLDLLTGLRRMLDHACDSDLDVFGGLLTASRTDPELAKLLREQMVADKRDALRSWTQRAVARGELPPGTNPDLAFEVAPAVVFTRLLLTGEPVDDAFLVHVVDDILLPLLTGSAGPA
jgi:AcrR family transcriptional regulator